MGHSAEQAPEQRLYPAMLYIEEVSKILDLHVRVILHLVKKGKMDTLGKRHDKSCKRFATAYILELCDDLEWLSMAREEAYLYWRRKNERRTAKPPQPRQT